MTFHPDSSKPSETKPFVIEHQKHDLTPSGQFVPGARLLVTSVLRTSGLLADLPDAEAKSLLLMLTFLTANGHIQASLPELAQALHTSTDKTRKRMQRLEEMRRQAEPLIYARTTGSGLEVFTLSPALVKQRDAPPEPSAQPPVPVYQAAGREAVIAHSRSRYAVPRAEAERMVAAQYGQDPEEAGEGPEAVARRHLSALGVPREQIAELFQNYALEDIQNQLDWLKHRGAKSPGRFVVAAIQGRYEPPARVRLEQAVAEENMRESEQEVAQQPASTRSIAADIFLEIPQDINGEETGQVEEGVDVD